jgi:hypothetical protein
MQKLQKCRAAKDKALGLRKQTKIALKNMDI